MFLVPRLGQGGHRPQPAHDGEPGGLGGLPGALVLAAHVGPVDDLIAVGHRAQHLNRQGRVAGGLEAHRHVAIAIGNPPLLPNP